MDVLVALTISDGQSHALDPPRRAGVVSPAVSTRYHVKVSEILPDGTTKQRFDGNLRLAVAQERNGELCASPSTTVRSVSGGEPFRA